MINNYKLLLQYQPNRCYPLLNIQNYGTTPFDTWVNQQAKYPNSDVNLPEGILLVAEQKMAE